MVAFILNGNQQAKEVVACSYCGRNIDKAKVGNGIRSTVKFINKYFCNLNHMNLFIRRQDIKEPLHSRHD